MIRTFTKLTAATAILATLGTLAAIGCSSSGQVSLGKEGQGVTVCDVSACGAALGIASTKCADGSTGGPTGRCIETAGATACTWEVHTCAPTGGGDCAVPAIACADGSTPTPKCTKNADGSCDCASPVCPPGGACTKAECGVEPGMPNYKCPDGSTGGPVCDRSSGTCGYHIRSCPTGVDAGPVCDTPAPFTCPDGTVIRPTCTPDSSGHCVCSSGTCSGSTDAGVVDGAPLDAGPACFDASGAIPDDMRRCGTDSDCVAQPHQLDCCGSYQDTGIASASNLRFKGCEGAWDAHFPGCGCAARPTITDDGKTITDPAKVTVHCVLPTSGAAGQCQTTLAP
ncbi:MAG: hypothetical protein NVSMB47_04440 [Polyangiales bacterium]